MKYPKLKIKFEPNLDKKTVKIIKRYWKMKDKMFVNSPTKLRTELNLTQPRLNSIVKDNSNSTLFLEKCVACEKPIQIQVTSQSTVIKLIENINYHCVSCLDKVNQEPNENPYLSEKLPHLNNALKFKLWQKLNKEELKVLKKIIEYSDYYTLKKKFINKNSEYYWAIIEKLDRLSLIDVQRKSAYSFNIKKIYYLPELAKELDIIPENNVHIESGMNFHLPEKFFRNESQPKYIKQIKFDKDILIQKGTIYICSVWENPDGSFHFGMKPASELASKNDETKDPLLRSALHLPRISNTGAFRFITRLFNF